MIEAQTLLPLNSMHQSIIVATKTGGRLPKQTAEGYSRQNLATWVE
jgi:hypothetical protein